MVATVPAGETRQGGRCNHADSSSVSWQPGTSFLYYIDRAEGLTDVIFRLDLETGKLLQLADKTLHPRAMQRLQCSPDGRSLLYVWRETAGTDAVVIRDLASGEEQTLAKIVGTGSAAWSEDSRAALTSTASGIGSEITAYPVDGKAPYRLYATTINVTHLAAGTGGLLALETDASRENLACWRATPSAHGATLTSSRWSTADLGADIRARRYAGVPVEPFRQQCRAWVMKPGTAPVLLYDAGLVPVFRLEYSPDGTRLAVRAGYARANGDFTHKNTDSRWGHNGLLRLSDPRRRCASRPLDAVDGKAAADSARQDPSADMFASTSPIPRNANRQRALIGAILRSAAMAPSHLVLKSPACGRSTEGLG